ncbi:MAG: alkaline phosphatase family protein, partial [Cyclobacteriaceae bacterium]|nr:alkaline phosphatase family protein [Cyclobacteriaceae bacterium]
MQKTVVINAVGLTSEGLEQMPFMKQWAEGKGRAVIKPVFPAVTCSAQSTYLTGKYPSEHGIVGNGWYFKEECEVKFWRQSNKLVTSEKIWDRMKKEDPSFTCANLFWWYNMYSTVDFSVTPRPNYLADGRKLPDCYSHPADLRDELQQKLGTFPLFDFWGPRTTIKSTRWIADASTLTDQRYDPTLTLVYLPHLDYNYQRHGKNHPSISMDLLELDEVMKSLIGYYESKKAKIIVLSEYGITGVNQPIHLNRTLREKGYIAVREERGLELLDAGASKAFAVADHQVAHVYLKDKSLLTSVKTLLEEIKGVETVLDEKGKKEYHLDHDRAGDLVVIADNDSWFTYYYWLDDKKAPDFARLVDIHSKPGYDPVEMFTDPTKKFITARVLAKLLRKKMGFRTLMDIIPLDASLVKGSHGRIPENKSDWPVIISSEEQILPGNELNAVDVYDVLYGCL